MINYKEVVHILIAIVVATFVLSFSFIMKGEFHYSLLLFNLLAVAIVISINILGKKFAAYYYEAKIEVNTWMWQRYGFMRHKHFKKPIPAGVLVPFFVSLLSFGNFIWLALMEFDVYSTAARASRRHGKYRFTEMTDIHIGLIAAAGVVFNLIFSIILYLIGLPEISKISIYYALFSLVPFGNLDGTKIFFGSVVLWISLMVISTIFLGFTFVP
ncbi:MAG: hypothetical protein QXJ28_01490 [Candidatus Pacearchaeota archaeon]